MCFLWSHQDDGSKERCHILTISLQKSFYMFEPQTAAYVLTYTFVLYSPESTICRKIVILLNLFADRDSTRGLILCRKYPRCLIYCRASQLPNCIHRCCNWASALWPCKGDLCGEWDISANRSLWELCTRFSGRKLFTRLSGWSFSAAPVNVIWELSSLQCTIRFIKTRIRLYVHLQRDHLFIEWFCVIEHWSTLKPHKVLEETRCIWDKTHVHCHWLTWSVSFKLDDLACLDAE